MKDWYILNSQFEQWAKSDSTHNVYIKIIFSKWHSEFNSETLKLKQPKYTIQFIDSRKKFPLRHSLEDIFYKSHSPIFDSIDLAKMAVDTFLAKISKMKSFL